MLFPWKSLLGPLAIAVLLYTAYAWAYARGAESRSPEVAQLTREKNYAVATMEAARATADFQAVAHAEALKLLKIEQAELLSGIKVKLDVSKAKAKALQEKLDAIIPIYITPQADAACTIPTGFVRVHNLSSSPDSSGPTSGTSVPRSEPSDVSDPSGVSLSTVASVVTKNYGECQARLEVIESWQTWYKGSLENWRKATEAQRAFVTVVPIGK